MSRSERRRRNSTSGVAIAYCHPEEVDANFASCLQTLLIWDAKHSGFVVRHGEVIAQGSGPRVAAARNEAVEAFLKLPSQPEWLLWLDADMIFRPDLIDKMMGIADRSDIPVLGGLCFSGGRTGKVEPTLKVLKPSSAGGPPIYETVWNYPVDSLVKVDATGAACLLVHRRIYEALWEKYGQTGFPWFAESSIKGTPSQYGEDVTFCMRVRMDLKEPIAVHTGLKIGHMKKRVIDEQSYVEYRRGITEMGEEGYRQRYLERMMLAEPNGDSRAILTAVGE